MAFTYENHITLTSDFEHTQEELLSYNPFAEPSTSTRGRTTTYQNSSNSRSSSHRRRASGNLVLEQNASSSRHARSKTEFDPSYGRMNSLHPLRSAGLRPDSGDAGITRPSLARMVKEGNLVDIPSDDNENDAKDEREEKKDVFVHQVRPGDSLAGVSLKYGIGLADLRRANHLWTSDSIHLRTVLYIPVEQATRLRKQNEKAQTCTGEDQAKPLDELDELDRISSPKTAKPTLPEETIQRVPASQLSFFPPASRSATHSPVSESSQTSSAVPSTRASPYNPRASGQSSSLSSLLHALPIAASTRDDIVSRLSFDSVSSSLSDRESEAPSEDLELDDVGQAGTRRNPYDVIVDQPVEEGGDAFAMITPKLRQSAHRVSEATIVDPRSVTHARHLSISPPAYIPPHTQIRTKQLEPSPVMQLPSRKPATSRSKRRHKDGILVDVELQSTSSIVS